MRPRRGPQKFGGLLATHAWSHAARHGEAVGAADDAARVDILSVADAGACGRDRRHRHAERFGIAKSGDACFVLADTGIVMNGGAAAVLGRHVGGVYRGVAAADHPGAVYIAAMSGTVDNKIAVLILQHPQEQDRVLGTAKLLVATLANAKLVVGLSWRNLAHALTQPDADPKEWGVLYLGSTKANTKGPLVALDRKGEPLADQPAALAGLKGIVVLDGNWSQAKALWWRNAWLTK